MVCLRPYWGSRANLRQTKLKIHGLSKSIRGLQLILHRRAWSQGTIRFVSGWQSASIAANFYLFDKRITLTVKRYCLLGDPCSRMLTFLFLVSCQSLRLCWYRVWCWHQCFRKWLELHHLIRNADSSVKSLHVSLIFLHLIWMRLLLSMTWS